jgi:uncharacterized delta-60 repeat protein
MADAPGRLSVRAPLDFSKNLPLCCNVIARFRYDNRRLASSSPMKTSVHFFCLAFLLTLTGFLAGPAQAAPGDLDALNANVDGNSVTAIAVQPDGKLILGSQLFTSVLGQPRYHIARLNADDTLDPVFNPNLNGALMSIAVQADGKILLAGDFTTVRGVTRNRIARLTADGALDAAFNPNANGFVSSIALQADGKILIGGGFTAVGGGARYSIARLAADGTLDPSFNPSAINPSATGYVYSMAVQADGKILLGGGFSSVGGVGRSRIARLASDGTLDPGFNPSANGDVYSFAVQADGRILVGGRFNYMSGVFRIGIARLASDGTLDASFNPSMIGRDGSVSNESVFSIAVQADGRILLGGTFTTVAGVERNRLARVNTDGTLDASFNPNVSNSVASLNSVAVHSVAVQADGRILLGGFFDTIGGATRNRFARLLNDPATQTLSAPETTQVIWTRGGSAPEVSQVTFDLSTDGGSSYTPLAGTAIRMGSTANWQLGGQSLPTNGLLRARGRTSGGRYCASSSVVETIASFNGLVTPALTVTGVSPPAGSIAGGTNVTITGTGFTGATSVSFGGTAATSVMVVNATTITATAPAHAPGLVSVEVTTPGGVNSVNSLYRYGTLPTVTTSNVNLLATTTTLTITGTGFDPSTPGNNLVVFTPAGTGTVTASTATTLTVTSLSGIAVGALNAVVIKQGLSSGVPVQVATVPVPVPGHPDFRNANLVGSAVHDTALQPDGKTIIAGTFTSVQGQPRSYIARFNVDGTLDAAFDPSPNGKVESVAVQPDGMILLGGSFTTVGGVARNYIARVAADGTLDAGFNPNAGGRVYCLEVLANHQILLGGAFTTVGGTARNCIARLNATGTLDSGFDPNANGEVYSVALQGDGRILLAGQFTTMGGIGRNRLARVQADGSLDPGFAPNVSALVYSVAVQADGRILLAGAFGSVDGVTRNRIARLHASGALDAGFNPNSNGEVYCVAVQADGRILFGGTFTTVGGSTRNRLARLAADGTLDPDFNPDVNNYVHSVALQADGQILVAGCFTSVGGTARNLLGWLRNDPATQSLAVADTSQVLWTRGGSSPEVSLVTFQQSSDGGVNYNQLPGKAIRVGATANWQLTGLTLPANGIIRARGRTTGGFFNGSSGLIESVAGYTAPTVAVPTVTAIVPPRGSSAGGTAVTITGSGFSGASAVTMGGSSAVFNVVNDSTLTATTPPGAAGPVSVQVSRQGTSAGNALYTYVTPPTVMPSTANLLQNWTTLTITGTDFDAVAGNNSIVLTPAGSGVITAATRTTLTVSLSAPALGPLYAVVTTNGQSSGVPAQVATMIATGPGAPEPLDAGINATVYATAVQLDGRTIIAGSNGIVRINADGTRDAGFNPILSGLYGDYSIYCVAVQADGRILIGGSFTKVGGIGRNHMARLNADGTLDQAFDPNLNGSVSSMAMQADGRILLGGDFNTIGGIGRNKIARVNANGTPDPSFNVNFSGNSYVSFGSLAVQADGRILIGGIFTMVGGIGRNNIARLNADGTLDQAFIASPGCLMILRLRR